MDEYIRKLTTVHRGRVRANLVIDGDSTIEGGFQLLNKFFGACEDDNEFLEYYLIGERIRFPLLELIEIVIDRDSPAILEIVCKMRKDEIYEIICTKIPQINSCSIDLKLKSGGLAVFMTFDHNIERIVQISKILGIKCEVIQKNIGVCGNRSLVNWMNVIVPPIFT